MHRKQPRQAPRQHQTQVCRHHFVCVAVLTPLPTTSDIYRQTTPTECSPALHLGVRLKPRPVGQWRRCSPLESPTAARRPLQPPLARVVWCSKVVDEDRKNGFRWSYRKPAGHPTQFPASLVPKYIDTEPPYCR
jgi:hypothetical protein